MRKRLYIFILICWLAGIFTLMLTPLPIPKEIGRITYYDKAAHLVFFGVATYLLIAIGLRWNKFRYFLTALIAITISFSLAVLAERLQGLIPGRDESWLDLLAGSLGMIAAYPIAYVIHYHPKKRLALHVCCAPCATAVREKLSAGYDLELFFSNSNIYPNAEYKKRLREVKKLAKRFNLKVKIDPYRHQEWKKAIAGHENDPEGGERCELCFIHRLKKTADMAKKSGFSAFTSTLSISPHKSTDMINRSGREAGEKLGIQYLEYDFKEQNGFSRSVELSKEYGLYRQKYCGCEFSIRPKKKT